MTSPTPTTVTGGSSTSPAVSTGETKAPEPEKASATTASVAKEVAAAENVEKVRDKVVRYALAGAGITRSISKADWESIKIKDQEAVEFNVINDFTLPASDFSAAALRYADKVDSTLIVEDAPEGYEPPDED